MMKTREFYEKTHYWNGASIIQKTLFGQVMITGKPCMPIILPRTERRGGVPQVMLPLFFPGVHFYQGKS